MNINMDEATPNGDLVRFENGKYLYQFGNGKFNIDQFNRDFDQYKDQRKEEMRKEIDKKLSELNKPPEHIAPYDLSVGQIMINTKDAIFNIIDDLFNFKISWRTVLRDNRLFYLGVFVIMIACILYFYAFFLADDNESYEMTPPLVIANVNDNKDIRSKFSPTNVYENKDITSIPLIVTHVHEIKLVNDQKGANPE